MQSIESLKMEPPLPRQAGSVTDLERKQDKIQTTEEIVPMVYSDAFALAYDIVFGRYTDYLAARIVAFSSAQGIVGPIIDLCCGAGRLTTLLLDKGYRVCGIDNSTGMLALAKQRAPGYVESGQAAFIQADAAEFRVLEKYGLVVSLTDSLAHLDGADRLRACLHSVFEAVAPGGHFVFDLQTKKGLRGWNDVGITDQPALLMIERGIYDGEGPRAVRKFSGFVLRDNGQYERFEQLIHNMAYAMDDVAAMLRETGWSAVQFVRLSDMSPVEHPEEEERLFIVARKEPK